MKLSLKNWFVPVADLAGQRHAVLHLRHDVGDDARRCRTDLVGQLLPLVRGVGGVELVEGPGHFADAAPERVKRASWRFPLRSASCIGSSICEDRLGSRRTLLMNNNDPMNCAQPWRQFV